MSQLTRGVAVVLAVVSVGALGGCEDKAKVSEDQAAAHALEAQKLADADVNEVRRGLAAGAKKLTTLIGTDREITPARARSLLRQTREAVTDLQVAKSTFFVLADPAGQAYASDLETDGFSGKGLFEGYPALARARDGYTETLGSLEAARGLRTGEDLQWVAGAPVAGPDGKAQALYVTGWSLRRFALHIEEQLKSNLRNGPKKDGKAKEPLLYAFVLRDAKVYGAPVVPEVNVKAVEGLGLPARLGAGSWHGQVEITNRTFGVAAQKLPLLCDTCSVAILRSEILAAKTRANCGY